MRRTTFRRKREKGEMEEGGRRSRGSTYFFMGPPLFLLSLSPFLFCVAARKKGRAEGPSLCSGGRGREQVPVCRDRVNSAAVELCEKVSRIRAGAQYIRTFYSRANCGPACLYCHILWLYSAAKTCLFALSLFRFSLLPLPYCFSCGKGGGDFAKGGLVLLVRRPNAFFASYIFLGTCLHCAREASLILELGACPT